MIHFITKYLEKRSFPSSFLYLSSVLFFTELVRSAFLISFLPVFTANRQNFSLTVVGLAVSLHYLADTGIKIAVGYVLDRFAPRIFLHTSFGLAVLGLLLAFFSQEPWMVVCGSVLLGLGISPIWLMCLSSIEEQNRAEQMGYIYTIWLAGLGLGPVAINFVLDMGISLSFWLLACILCFGWILAIKCGDLMKATVLPIPVRQQFRQLKEKMMLMKPLIPGMVLQTMAAGLLVPILPSFATQYLGLSYSEYSFILIIGGLSTALFLIPMGKLADKRGHKWFLVAGFAFLAVCLYALLFSSHFYVTLLLAVLLGLSYSAVLPSWNALLSYFIPQEQKGTGWGILSSVEGLGIILGPVIGGGVANALNETFTVMISASLLAVISVVYSILRLHLPPAGQ